MVLGLGSVVYSRVDATNQARRDPKEIAVEGVVYSVASCMRTCLGPRGVS
jgi:hypothetical protein